MKFTPEEKAYLYNNREKLGVIIEHWTLFGHGDKVIIFTRRNPWFVKSFIVFHILFSILSLIKVIRHVT